MPGRPSGNDASVHRLLATRPASRNQRTSHWRGQGHCDPRSREQEGGSDTRVRVAQARPSQVSGSAVSHGRRLQDHRGVPRLLLCSAPAGVRSSRAGPPPPGSELVRPARRPAGEGEVGPGGRAHSSTSLRLPRGGKRL